MLIHLNHLRIRRSAPVSFVSPKLFLALLGAVAAPAAARQTAAEAPSSAAQVAQWSADDMRFFLHGSIGTEVVPENVLKAFRATYPDLFPGKDLTSFGLIADATDEYPIGISRREVQHLGGLRSIGINCASCHCAEIAPADGGKPVRVLGGAGHFDAEDYLGAVAVATFRTADPANMARFLPNYLEACDSKAAGTTRESLATRLRDQRPAIEAAITKQRSDEGSMSDKLCQLDPATLSLTGKYLETNQDVVPIVRSLLQLFHNMRVALHIPHQPPEKASPPSGPGRNNAFGSLSLALFGEQTLYGPAKYGLVWNLNRRNWVHWDGNTHVPVVRNLAASLGLGAPLVGGHQGMVDFTVVDRQTRLTEQIRAPRYPWAIDAAAAARGKKHFETHCASCHVRSSADAEQRLYDVDEVKTDPNRARLFTEHEAELFNKFFNDLIVTGYTPSPKPAIRSTGKYIAVDMDGVWARAPYLHNGSVRTMMQLLTPSGRREKTFHRGSRVYDPASMGYVDGGSYAFDASTDGNSNTGHEYGANELNDEQKRELIEYLKTL